LAGVRGDASWELEGAVPPRVLRKCVVLKVVKVPLFSQPFASVHSSRVMGYFCYTGSYPLSVRGRSTVWPEGWVRARAETYNGANREIGVPREMRPDQALRAEWKWLLLDMTAAECSSLQEEVYGKALVEVKKNLRMLW